METERPPPCLALVWSVKLAQCRVMVGVSDVVVLTLKICNVSTAKLTLFRIARSRDLMRPRGTIPLQSMITRQ